MHLDMEDGASAEVTGADVYNLVFNSGQPWNISANGTIFKTDFQGIVPWTVRTLVCRKTRNAEEEKGGN